MKRPVGNAVLAAIVLAAGVFFLFRWWSSHGEVRLHTSTLLKLVGHAYEAYLADDGDASAFQSPGELVFLLEGNNPRHILYLDLPAASRNDQGQVIDDLGRPLQIQRLEGQRVKISAAGRDGKFGTHDDFVGVHPREKASGE